MKQSIIILFCLFSACWQALAKPIAFTTNEPYATLSAIDQGVPPFCEEINTSNQIVSSFENLSSFTNATICLNELFIKFLWSGLFIQDINRFQFVSIFLFPFHYFF